MKIVIPGGSGNVGSVLARAFHVARKRALKLVVELRDLELAET
jgi:hypothetical protein